MGELYSLYQDVGQSEHPDHARALIRGLLTAAQKYPVLKERALTIATGVAQELTASNNFEQLPSRNRNPRL